MDWYAAGRAGRKSLQGYNEHLLILGPRRRWLGPESNSGPRASAQADKKKFYLHELQWPHSEK